MFISRVLLGSGSIFFTIFRFITVKMLWHSVLYNYQGPWLNRDFVSHIIIIFLCRVASMILQFTAGMNSCGHVWEVMCNNWRAFLPLFTNTRGKLKRNGVRDLFDIAWSTPGSNKRDLEEQTVFQWECWLMSSEGVFLLFNLFLLFAFNMFCFTNINRC